jgi:hypothetical protein
VFKSGAAIFATGVEFREQRAMVHVRADEVVTPLLER